jgi:hypothetical protein
MLVALVLLAQVSAAATPATTPALGASSASVSGKPRTLADIAAERKLGKKPGSSGTLSVAGASTSGSDTTTAISNLKVQTDDVKKATAAQERMTRALDNASWVNQNIHYNYGIIQGAKSEWDAAAENCRTTPGCTPIYRPGSK